MAGRATFKRLLPLPVRVGVSQLEDTAANPGDDSILPSEDPFTLAAGGVLAETVAPGGIKYSHSVDTGLPGFENGKFHTIEAKSGGTTVGRALFLETPEGLKAKTVTVDPEFQRQGIGTHLYRQAEKKSGLTAIPDEHQTDAAKSLWDQPNRPFGNKKKPTTLNGLGTVQGGTMGSSWRDTVKSADEAPASSWRDTIAQGDMEDVPYAASAAAGFEKAVPFSAQVGAAGKTAMDVLSGAQPLSGALDQYRSERDALGRDLEAKTAANPKSAMAGGLVSGLAMPIPGGSKGMAAYGGAEALGNSKADLTKGEIIPALEDTAKGAATGAVIGDAAEQAGKYLSPATKKVSDFLRSKAEGLKLKATGLTGKEAAKLRPGTGRYLLDNKIGGAFSDPGAIADAAEASMDKSGNSISDALENKLKGTTVDRSTIINRIKEKINALSNDESQTELATKLKSTLDDIEAKATENPSIPISDAEKIKRGFQKKVNWKSPDPKVIENNANTEVSSAYRQAVEDAATKADPGLGAQFKADKENYATLSPIEEGARKRALQLRQSPHGGLLDIASAGAGGGIGASLGGPIGAPVGAALGYAAKSLRPRYASMGAHGTDILAKIAAKSPELAAKIAPSLEETATRKATPVLMRDNKGNIRSVRADQVEAAFAAGGELVEDDE